MNNKIRTITNIALAALFIALVSSCLKNEVEEKVLTEAEQLQIQQTYLDSLVAKGADIDTTESGVYYVIMEPGEGDFAEYGDTLTVGYAGFFPFGPLFDTSVNRFPEGKMKFILGEDRMITGWEEGMRVMNKGSKVEFVIPSELAYGDRWYYSIPPYQTLVFVIVMYDIKPRNS